MSPLIISAWSATSPFGVGDAAFRDGVAAGRSAVAAVDRETYPGPLEQGALVPEFSAREHVGKKGTRTMDRLSALAVATVGGLVPHLDDELSAHPEQTAIVLGTGSGSVQSIMDFTKDSYLGERPYHVDPARFPNAVMNRAAGQSAIWHRIKGPNTTIAGGALTGLLALSYAVRLLKGGHCVRALCGAVEEYSTQRSWLEWHGRPEEERRTPLGEGSAVFLVESAEDAAAAGRVPLAEVAAVRFRAFAEPDSVRRTLADCLRGALEAAGVKPGEIRTVVPLGGGGPYVAAEEAAVRDVLEDLPDDAEPRWIRLSALVGDTSAAATSLQLAASLAVAGDTGLAPGEAALVTAVERDGMVGCAVLVGGGSPR
ncbi:beta-ketoacyl synthase N-terminal-like domain-containing protein [Streptomyces sp. NPDC006645]|uniref:beta-ketoacyl synthase N-terminal-like domain-containing protein n=1 Tax=unclassified Streptomyces TaxID=2593676 RepID=UPI0033ADC1DC